MKDFGPKPGLLRKIHRNYKVARHLPKIWILPSPDIGYVKITKVASTSVEYALSQYIHNHIDGGDKCSLDEKQIRQYSNQYATHLDPRSFPKGKRPAFVFTFVRNPLDRLLSSYMNKIVDVRNSGEYHNIFWNHDITLNMSFDEFVERIVDIPDSKIDRHLRSQASCLWDGESLIADFVGKFENMSEDWKSIADQFGLPPMPHENSSTNAELENLYSVKTAKIVAERFQQDIDLFSYGNEIDQFIESLK